MIGIVEGKAFAGPSEDHWALASLWAQIPPQLQTQLRPGRRGPATPGTASLGPSPSIWDPPSSHLELPEGRIPMAPEFTAAFILSKTRGDTPRSKGPQQNKLRNNKTCKRWSEPSRLLNHKLFHQHQCFLWCWTLETCGRIRGQPPTPVETSLKGGLRGGWKNLRCCSAGDGSVLTM